MRLVVSLTTIPERRALLERTLASLRSQSQAPDAVYLWLPQERFAGCDAGDYRFPGVEVRVGADLGPAMKLLPVLDIETDPETCIVTVDDDVEYPPELIARLSSASRRYPDQAIGFTGWVLPSDASATSVVHLNAATPGVARMQPVHVLEGYRGVLYKRRFFGLEDIRGHLEALSAFRFHDDILLSGYLAVCGIQRLVRWYGTNPLDEAGYWGLNGDAIGLHTTPGWLEQGRACVEYWLRQDPGVFGPVGCAVGSDLG